MTLKGDITECLAGQMLVRCRVQIEAGMGGSPICCTSQGTVRSLVHIHIQEEVATFLSFHGELDVVNATKLVQEIVSYIFIVLEARSQILFDDG